MKENMIIIYDFDGTLTPYSLPQYEILKRCGYDDNKLIERIKNEINANNSLNLYQAYFKCYVDILKEHNIELNMDSICLGVDKTRFNKSVEEYFNRMQFSKTGIKHYIITSGIKEYVKRTSIGSLVNDIYGVTFKRDGEKITEIDFLVTDKKKVDIIKEIAQENSNKNIVYLGDGLTDADAFEYVHSISGKSIFIMANNDAIENYKKLKKQGIIDEGFDADFSEGSDLDNFLKVLINF